MGPNKESQHQATEERDATEQRGSHRRAWFTAHCTLTVSLHLTANTQSRHQASEGRVATSLEGVTDVDGITTFYVPPLAQVSVVSEGSEGLGIKSGYQGWAS